VSAHFEGLTLILRDELDTPCKFLFFRAVLSRGRSDELPARNEHFFPMASTQLDSGNIVDLLTDSPTTGVRAWMLKSLEVVLLKPALHTGQHRLAWMYCARGNRYDNWLIFDILT
jgi:hypothetical protein